MPTFAFRAVTPEGEAREGREAAPSPAELRERLGRRGLLVLSVSRDRDRSSGFRMRLPVARRREVTRLFRYLATLLDAGFPVERALATASRASRRDDVREAVEEVRRAVREGRPLADALGDHSVFPRLAVGVTRAGERGGHLDDALDRLADHLERAQGLRSRLSSALVYPGVMVLAGAASLAVLIGYVLPRFTEVLAEAGVALPASTRLLLRASALWSAWWPVAVLAALGVGAAVRRWARTPEGRGRIHALVHRVPVVGSLRRRFASAQVGRTLATLLRGGVPLLTSLDVTREALTDRVVSEAVDAAAGRIERGETLASALSDGGAFPETFTQMVEVGEEGGRLAELLDRGADMMEDELESGLERLVRLVEPCTVLVFGLVVGFIALSLLQAVYGIHSGGLPG